MNFYDKYVKRGLDLFFAFLALPFLMLIMLMVAPFIWLEDKGPIFYDGLRLGRNGVPFSMYKFRSMKVNAPDIRLEDGSTYNGDDDPRVTKIGNFLRKTSIDELPQIFNILKGEMSWVGVRPDPVDEMGRYTEEEKRILLVKGGITGWNQAICRNEAGRDTKIKNDLYYVDNISIGLDIKIVLLTIKSVLFRENINRTVAGNAKKIDINER